MVVNGKEYPLWSQFVERQNEWKGGILEDFGDNFDRGMGANPMVTEITGISLKPNGKDSAFFTVEGKDFRCGFDVKGGGITAGEEGWITISGYGSHTWRFKQPIKDKIIELTKYFSSLSPEDRKEFLKQVHNLDQAESKSTYEQNHSYYLKKKEKDHLRGLKMKKNVKPGMFVKCEGTKDRVGIREVLEVNDVEITARKISRNIQITKDANIPNKYIYVRDSYITTHLWDKVVKIINKPNNFK